MLVVLILGGSVLAYLFRAKEARHAMSASSDRKLSTETQWGDYQWPTDASTERTSNFAEFRSNHFHAGIDVSTNMRTGYKVFASRAGWLHSITFEPFGYGWILTLKHPDGFHTCYAHLQGFPEKILKAYRRKLAEEGHSFGLAEWAGEAVPVTKGDVVAFTGETGAGPAHLHFEIRDKEFNPVNPGLAKQLRPVDSIAPEPRQLCFSPLDASSSVNGIYGQVIVNIIRKSDGSFSLASAPVLRGRIGLMLRAHDRAQGAEDYPTPYKIQMRVDKALRFESRFDWIQDALGWHIRIDRDHWLMQKKKGEFRKLFREEGNVLAVYTPDTVDAGVLSQAAVGAGLKHITLAASDISGNTANIAFDLIIEPDIRCTVSVGTKDEIRLAEVPADLLSRIELSANDRKGAKIILKVWQKKDIHAEMTSARELFPGGSATLTLFDTKGRAACSIPVTGKHRYRAGTMNVTREILFDEVLLTLSASTAFSQTPSVQAHLGKQSIPVRLTALSPSQYRAVITTEGGMAGLFQFLVVGYIGGEKKEWRDQFSGACISSQEGGELRSEDGNAIVRFKPNDVYRSLLCGITTVAAAAGSAYQTFPDDVPIAGKPLVLLKGGASNRKMFIRATNTGTRYRFSRSVQSGGSAFVQGEFGRLLGRYELVEDTSPPVIQARVMLKNVMAIQLGITDSVSGVDSQSIIAKGGATILPVEFSERSKIYFIPRSALQGLKANTITVSVSDNMGNVARKDLSFR